MSQQLHLLCPTSRPHIKEHILAWRPSGNLLAAAVRRPACNRHVVAFFEKNGLQHGELQLRSDHQETEEEDVVVVRELEWNCDSSVLAVWLQSPKGRGKEVLIGHCPNVTKPAYFEWSRSRNSKIR